MIKEQKVHYFWIKPVDRLQMETKVGWCLIINGHIFADVIYTPICCISSKNMLENMLKEIELFEPQIILTIRDNKDSVLKKGRFKNIKHAMKEKFKQHVYETPLLLIRSVQKHFKFKHGSFGFRECPCEKCYPPKK